MSKPMARWRAAGNGEWYIYANSDVLYRVWMKYHCYSPASQELFESRVVAAIQKAHEIREASYENRLNRESVGRS